MKIEKSVLIGKGSREIYDYLKYTRNQDNFSVWNMTDPSMKREYAGSDGSVGFIYRWDSMNKNVGAGEQMTAALVDGRRIDFTLKFLRPMKNTGTSSFLIEEESGTTKVSWIFESPSKFPMSLFSPVFKRMLGKDLEKGLSNLKTILEKA
jgi:hypothetical protein